MPPTLSDSVMLRGKFGRWTAISKVGKNRWLCRCKCGVEKVVLRASLRSGGSRSCGCLKLETSSSNGRMRRVHGLTKTPLYVAWNGMIRRCYNPKCSGYKNYGGRGIMVCKRWLKSLHDFCSDMGDRPGPEYSLDRINNDGNYEPGNVKWATKKEQSFNTRRTTLATIDGVTKPMIILAKELGLNPDTVRRRVYHMGLTPTEALNYKKGAGANATTTARKTKETAA